MVNGDEKEDRNYECASQVSEQRSDKIKLSVKPINDTKLEVNIQSAKDAYENQG